MKKKVLLVFAHPDDESFAAGGTIAKASAHGHQVFLVCLTSGCGGKSGSLDIRSREQLAAHREEELQEACSVLGISDLILYRYADGTLKDEDNDRLARRIRDTIAEMKPDIVVTFPPDGVTGHPDHIAVSEATEKAVAWAEADYLPGTLPHFYYVCIPHYYDHCQEKGPRPSCRLTGKVDIGDYRSEKGRALQSHKSQVYSVNRAYPGVMQGDFSVIGNYEYYALARAEGKAVQPGDCSEAKGPIPVISMW
ncbi:PIG-L deacetylase family protein [Paenibacillus hodogayensis]|uniref:PIG-L deacetylase family protein n=1 Tax=Paenibacillus hodogayensis TaxID=279208 RepID=A0ABV5VW01_9BACL